MPIRVLLAALAATASLAACGSDNNPTSSDTKEKNRQALLAYARCMRQHGVDMADPKFNSDGGVTMSQGGPGSTPVSKSELDAAQEACEKYQKQIKAPDLSPEEQAEFRKAALKNAQCMRDHGISNFPDPEFGADGGAQIKIRKGSGIDPQSPKFQAAQKQCAKYMPNRDGQ
jgi:hypothetical protein